MKVAVGLFGIHYEPNLSHWMNWNLSIDYKHTYENTKKNINKCQKLLENN